MKLFVVTVFLLFLTRCGKDNSQDTSSVIGEEETSENTQLTKNDIEAIRYIDYGLSNSTKKAVSTWTGYSELETLIGSIKNGNLSYFEGDDEIMAAFIKDLKTNVPDQIDNQSIVARLTAFETKFYKLKSAVTIKTTTKEELISTIKEFFEACSNLNLQMNKKLEKEDQDISKTTL